MATRRRLAVNPAPVAPPVTAIAGPLALGVLLECAAVWQAGVDNLASAIFLGGRWLITAQHAVQEGKAGNYLVTLPIDSLRDMRPPNTFRVTDVIPSETPGQDLALLQVSDSTNAPAAPNASLVRAEDFPPDSSVQLCGFGSDDCLNDIRAGDKRLSLVLHVPITPVGLIPPVDTALGFAVDDGGATPVTCDHDSGGGAYVTVGGVLRLAGIIRETVVDATGKPFTHCMRILPALDWIRQTTHLPL